MKIELTEFNNLSKTLTCCIYTIYCTDTTYKRKKLIEYINKAYNAVAIRDILKKIANIIGAEILSITEYDYKPYGASVNVLTSDSSIGNKDICAHLDKSHISVHTYPDIAKESLVSFIRIDLEISTCGNINPLKALPLIINSFNPDILIYDLKIRGVMRNEMGERIYTCDNIIRSIRNFNKKNRKKYIIKNIYSRRHCEIEVKMLRRKMCFSQNTDIKEKALIYNEAKKIFLKR